MAEYFSHDTNARNDMKCAKLIKALGYKGYGVFWAVIELMNEQSDCRLPADFAQLGWQLHINAKVLERVVREFGLFKFSDDGSFFWSETARRRFEMRRGTMTAPSMKIHTGKRGRPAKNAGNTFPVQPCQVDDTRENVARSPETAQKNVPTDVVNNLSTDVQNAPENAKEAAIRESERINAEEYAEDLTQDAPDLGQPNEPEQIIAEWNSIFKGTPQECRWGGIFTPAAWHEWTQAKEMGYTLKDLFTAFRVAKNDDWAWQLKDVVKNSNIQRLLTKKARAKKNGNGDWMEGKQYCDANGNPLPEGAEFVSPEFWDDWRNARKTEDVGF